MPGNDGESADDTIMDAQSTPIHLQHYSATHFDCLPLPLYHLPQKLCSREPEVRKKAYLVHVPVRLIDNRKKGRNERKDSAILRDALHTATPCRAKECHG